MIVVDFFNFTEVNNASNYSIKKIVDERHYMLEVISEGSKPFGNHQLWHGCVVDTKVFEFTLSSKPGSFRSLEKAAGFKVKRSRMITKVRERRPVLNDQTTGSAMSCYRYVQGVNSLRLLKSRSLSQTKD